MNKNQIKKAIPDVLNNWTTKYDAVYASSIPATPKDNINRRLYELEQHHAPDAS